MSKPSLDQLRIERKPEPASGGKTAIAVAGVVLVAAAATAWWWTREAAVPVRTAAAVAAEAGKSGTVLNASGYVTARRQATVSSKVTGKVTEILIEEGMAVELDQVLARLDSTNVDAALRLAEAEFKSSQTALKETEALLVEAKLNFDRINQLAEKDLASEADRDRSRAVQTSLAAQLELRQSQIEVARRQVDIYRQQVEDTIIRAPFAGIVVAKNAQPGEMISPISAGGGFTRTGIGTIVDMQSLEIEIDVNEAYINRVRSGQPVVATLDAYPDWQIPCHVIAIIPTADRQRATVGVRVGFDSMDERILPDMGVKVGFQDETVVARSAPGVQIPAAAVKRDGEHDIVWVVTAGALERRAVTTSAGDQASATRLVLAGLKPGERVVIEGPAQPAEGMMVEEMAE